MLKKIGLSLFLHMSECTLATLETGAIGAAMTA